MFCPHCGNDCVDGAQFCPKCGYQLSDRAVVRPAKLLGESQQQPAPQQPTLARPSQGQVPQGAGQPAPSLDAQQAAPRRKPRVSPAILGVLAAVLVLVVAFVVFDPIPKVLAMMGIIDNQNITLTEEAPSRESPKEDVIVTDLKLDEDQLGRYVITGKITNSSTETYDVDIKFSAVRHHPDKYGEYQTDSTDITFDTITPFTRADWSTLEVYDLGKGTREFTIYPDWTSAEETLSDPDYSIESISRSNAQATSRFDHDNKIKVTDTRYTSDGKIELKFVNNTDFYLNKVDVTLVGINDNGVPAIKNHGDRNSGAVIKSCSADTLKPGDDGILSVDVGEGYSTVDVIDILYTPDPDKGPIS